MRKEVHYVLLLLILFLLNSYAFFQPMPHKKIKLPSKPVTKIKIGTLGLAFDNEKNYILAIKMKYKGRFIY